MKSLKIGNAQGFWGDQVDAPRQLVQQQPDLDYLTLDYLAEVSMSIMAIQKQKKPSLGYARDFIEVIKSLIPLWEKGSRVKVIANAGGLNPYGCAQACREVLQKSSLNFKIGVVSGDNVLDQLKAQPDAKTYHNLDSELPLNVILPQLMTANAYLGAKPIVEALQQDAQIIITGRITDPSLAVAPCVAHFGWRWDEYDKLAGATIAGHLIECGTQVTGGIATDWLNIPDPAHLGFPYVEMASDGSFVITKPAQTSGKVTQETVKEQLLYEIGDPEHFLGPDVTCSFLSLELKDEGPNRILVKGARGKPPTSSYKVSATYSDGYRAEGMLAIFGSEAPLKAIRCGEIILQRLRDQGWEYCQSRIECLGGGDLVPGIFSQNSLECMLRIAVADPREEAVERFTKEIAPLVTSGPQGVTGYISGRPHVRPVFGYWPCLIPKNQVFPKVEILQVNHEAAHT